MNYTLRSIAPFIIDLLQSKHCFFLRFLTSVEGYFVPRLTPTTVVGYIVAEWIRVKTSCSKTVEALVEGSLLLNLLLLNPLTMLFDNISQWGYHLPLILYKLLHDWIKPIRPPPSLWCSLLYPHRACCPHILDCPTSVLHTQTSFCPVPVTPHIHYCSSPIICPGQPVLHLTLNLFKSHTCSYWISWNPYVYTLFWVINTLLYSCYFSQIFPHNPHPRALVTPSLFITHLHGLVFITLSFFCSSQVCSN